MMMMMPAPLGVGGWVGGVGGVAAILLHSFCTRGGASRHGASACERAEEDVGTQDVSARLRRRIEHHLHAPAAWLGFGVRLGVGLGLGLERTDGRPVSRGGEGLERRLGRAAERRRRRRRRCRRRRRHNRWRRWRRRRHGCPC
jgi:hypothetical protein